MARISSLDEARLAILQPLRARLEECAHGGKTRLVREAARALGCSPQTVYQDLRALGYQQHARRRPRRDYGRSQVTDAEVLEVAAMMAAAHRENAKRLLSFTKAMDDARANGLLRSHCSASTLARRMRVLGVHPDQFERPAAHVNLKSAHPNQVWQVDPSLCVLYRLPNGDVRLARDDDDLVYKNKLDNLKALDKRRKVWRYVQWDHYSSAFFFKYYETPGESAEVLLDFLIDASADQSERGVVMHGWPELILWDKGSANKAAPVKNLLDALQVRHLTHRAHAARVKGGVERANNLIEMGFESGLTFADIPTLDELNARAEDWMIDCNALAQCSRTQTTRYGLWQTIRQEHLRASPAPERLRLYANSTPEQRVVKGDLTVSWAGKRYDAAPIATVSAGERVRVAVNAWASDQVWLILLDAEGKEQWHACQEVTRDAAGFLSNAVPIGEFRQAVDTPVDAARKDLREAAWGTRDENEAAAARRKGRVAMDGRVDPYAAVAGRKDQLPTHVRRRASELHVPDTLQLTIAPLTQVEMLLELHARLGRPITAPERAAVAAWFPDGCQPADIDGLVARVTQLADTPTAPAVHEPRLRAV